MQITHHLFQMPIVTNYVCVWLITGWIQDISYLFEENVYESGIKLWPLFTGYEIVSYCSNWEISYKIMQGRALNESDKKYSLKQGYSRII